jgi:hypothetical protein
VRDDGAARRSCGSAVSTNSQDLYEDQTPIAKLALHCRIRVDTATGERYRQHEGSSTSRAIREGAYHPWRPNAARRRYLDWLDRYSAQLEAPPSDRSPQRSHAPRVRTATRGRIA